MLRLIDAHAHLHDEAFHADRAEVLSRMRDAGIGAITVGTTLATSRAAVALAEREENVWATIGIHPTDSAESFDETVFGELAAHPKVVGIGECGIDYFRLEAFSGNKDAEADRQQNLFEEQARFAAKSGKPLMIHGRPTKGTEDAYEDILHILESLKKEHPTLSGNFHFFSGGVAIARRVLALGFTASFSGVVTFAREYDAVVREMPGDNILVETDSPYASPAPERGKRNDPTRVALVARELSRIRGEDLSAQLFKNTTRVFGLSPK